MGTRTRKLIALTAWTLAAIGCGGGSGGSGQGKDDPGITQGQRDELRTCVLGQLPGGAPAAGGEVSGHDLVTAFQACRPPSGAAADARAFRATMEGFAAPVEGSPTHYTITR